MIHLMTYIMNIIMNNIMINVMTDIIMNLVTNITKSGLSQPRPPWLPALFFFIGPKNIHLFIGGLFMPTPWFCLAFSHPRGDFATIHSRFIALIVHIAFMCLLLFNVHMVNKFILPIFVEFGDGLWFWVCHTTCFQIPNESRDLRLSWSMFSRKPGSWTFTGWAPPVISWFINHYNPHEYYSYIYHKP